MGKLVMELKDLDAKDLWALKFARLTSKSEDMLLMLRVREAFCPRRRPHSRR